MDTTRTYTIILEPDEDGGFVVHVPALPEVCTQGDTEDDALTNAREAIELALEQQFADGEQAPPEQEPRLHRVTVNVASSATP